MFNKHKKNDDLADCFLQGLWYMCECEPMVNLTALTKDLNIDNS